MTIYVIVFGELLRAFSWCARWLAGRLSMPSHRLARRVRSRSMRESIFAIGFFSNPWMQYSVPARSSSVG